MFSKCTNGSEMAQRGKRRGLRRQRQGLINHNNSKGSREIEDGESKDASKKVLLR